MIWDEFLRHFRFCDEEDSGLSDEEQERKGPKNRPKHTRKRIHQVKKNFLEKFKTASKVGFNARCSLYPLASEPASFLPFYHIIHVCGQRCAERLIHLLWQKSQCPVTVIVHHPVGVFDASLPLYISHKRCNLLV